jgi:hypothetical protein
MIKILADTTHPGPDYFALTDGDRIYYRLKHRRKIQWWVLDVEDKQPRILPRPTARELEDEYRKVRFKASKHPPWKKDCGFPAGAG